MKPPRTAPPPLTAAPPAPAPAPRSEPATYESSLYTPPGLGPSNPPPAAAPAGVSSTHPGLPPQTAQPSPYMPPGMPGVPAPGYGPPPLSPDQLFGKKPTARSRIIALVATLTIAAVVLSIVFLGGSAGASNLKLVFTSGETHTYSIEMTVDGRGGNLDGGFAANSIISADFTQKTGAVDKSGAATLTYTISHIHFFENGRTVPIPPGAGGSFSAKMRPDGKVVGFDGGDPFGLEDVSPAGQFVGPANAGPLLPSKDVKPGKSWTVDVTEKMPDIGKLHVHSQNTLVKLFRYRGNDAAQIRSTMSVPLNLHIGHDELVRQSDNKGESTDIPGNAGISMVGNMSFNLDQIVYTANGLLQSAIGDGDITGTMTFEGLPIGRPVSIVFDLHLGITMTNTSTGQSA